VGGKFFGFISAWWPCHHLAVVAGFNLCRVPCGITTSTMVIKKRARPTRTELKVSRITTLVLGGLRVVLALL
jgi:Na+(H+)/acetate symporter ActP